MWIREGRHQATTLVGAVPGVHVGRRMYMYLEVKLAPHSFYAFHIEAQSIKGDEIASSFNV